MAYQGRTASLSVEQAEKLLTPIVGATVIEVRQVGFTNDVFSVTTHSHGPYYVKFHTARCYLDLDDTAPVVDRELAGYELLHQRGVELPYGMWEDCTRRIVPQSVVIIQHLPGDPVPTILARERGATGRVAAALGHYLRRLHAIEFTHRGALSRAHVASARPSGVIPYLHPHPNNWYSWEKEDPCVKAQREALQDVREARSRGLLRGAASDMLEWLFAELAQTMQTRLTAPRFCFALVNCHAHHFHAECDNGQWRITGVYDFEAVSADDPTNDLLEIEIGLTTASRGFAWREGLRAAYGPPPDFAYYKLCLLRALVYYLLQQYRAGRFREMIPDPAWLASRWADLAAATTWDELAWYPSPTRGNEQRVGGYCRANFAMASPVRRKMVQSSSGAAPMER